MKEIFVNPLKEAARQAIEALEPLFGGSTKPRVIVVTEVLSSKLHRNWNYARYVNLDGKGARLEPCCLKSKPCWECS